MATVSSTPMGSSHFGQASRRPSTRQFGRQRPTVAHGEHLPSGSVSHSRKYSINDSSDDEIPMPMKFSALTNALLNDESSRAEAPTSPYQTGLSGSTAVEEVSKRGFGRSTSSMDVRSHGRSSPQGNLSDSPAPRRVVRLSGTPRSLTLRRDAALSNSIQRSSERVRSRKASPLVVETPVPLPRTVRLPLGSSEKLGRSTGSSAGASSRVRSAPRSDAEDMTEAEAEEPSTAARPQSVIGHGSVSRYGSSALGRSRYGEETGVHGSLRVKRVGKVAGSFLSGPARRGIRRQSEEEQTVLNEEVESQEYAASSQEPESQSQEPATSQESENPSFSTSQNRHYPLGSPVQARNFADSERNKSPTPERRYTREEPEDARVSPSGARLSIRRTTPSHEHPSYGMPKRTDLPATHDQENEPPPTFKRNKHNSSALLSKQEAVPLRSHGEDRGVMQAVVSPERRPLKPRSQNTPLRPAPPPPPKMSVLETATTNAGAATSTASRKRNIVKIKNKVFTRMDLLGRGGSSRVFRVMAENYKVFALKKVNLEEAEESAVRGYKGEIDLLKKLEGVDRVVRLYDYEINEEKGTLSVLMEMGEMDFNKILTLRLSADNAKLDISFTRYYWKEMLECLKAVHEHDIVHSDLKPANFVLVHGRLKLIDFGIANAIETDETVNVHRADLVGTPNYMSPESLEDTNATATGRYSNAPRLMKLGKPSDIWSLGCILYQMTYGRPPFAHIQNQLSRIKAITDTRYNIEYSSTGVGGIRVPSCLITTLKRCLDRDQHQRPSAAELLDDDDPFLNPIDYGVDSVPMTADLLGRILTQVAQKCQEGTPSVAELSKLWPEGYLRSIQKSIRDGKF